MPVSAARVVTLSRALIARGAWRLIDVVVLPALCVFALFLLLGKYEAFRRDRPSAYDGAPLRMHRVVAGDDLRGIAARYYGDPRHWMLVFEANRARLVGRPLEPGLELVIPPAPRR